MRIKMRIKVADGIWIDPEKFDRITLKEIYLKAYYHGWIWEIEIYEKNNILIASMSFEKGHTAKKLVDKMYSIITYEIQQVVTQDV